MFFPHLATNRKGILCAMANEPNVQAWVDSPGDNFGWEYRITEEDVLDNARRLLPCSFTIYWQAQLNFSSGFESP
jgi:hypothetical protein